MRYLVLALAALALATPALAQQQPPAPPRILTVNGQAEEKLVPDEAHLFVNVNAHDPKLAGAKAAHDKQLKALLKLADDMGIEEKYLKTQNSSVYPEYDYVDGKQKFRTYRVSSALDITVKKIDAVGDLLEKLTAGGFSETNINYTVSDMDKARDAIIADAIKNAHDKAERMAAAAGASLGRVHAISEGGVNFSQPPMPMMAMGLAKAADASVAPPAGEQEVNANVTVSYELKD